MKQTITTRSTGKKKFQLKPQLNITSLHTSSSNSLQVPQKYLPIQTPQFMHTCCTWNNQRDQQKGSPPTIVIFKLIAKEYLATEKQQLATSVF